MSHIRNDLRTALAILGTLLLVSCAGEPGAVENISGGASEAAVATNEADPAPADAPPPPESAPPETAPPESAPPETAPPETAPPETAPPETAPAKRPDAIEALERAIKPDEASIAAAKASGEKPTPAPAPKSDPKPAPAPKSDPKPEPAPEPLPPLSDAEKKPLIAELEKRVRQWAAALDAEDEKALLGMLVDDAFLKASVTPGSYTILAGTLVPKNRDVTEKLVRFAKERDVAVVKWEPGEISRTDGRSIFTRQLVLVTQSMLEISLGGVPVELEIGQAVKHAGEWLLMRISVRS